MYLARSWAEGEEAIHAWTSREKVNQTLIPMHLQLDSCLERLNLELMS
jgi:hypothetical protein